MKPVASGCGGGGRLRCLDAEQLVEASGADDAPGLVTPLAFGPPLAPTAAARASGQGFDRAAVFTAFCELRSRHEILLVEGIGGLLVPLEATWTVRDMAREMAAPVVIVSRNALGTINHTALTCEAALSAGLEVRGIVLNSTEAPEGDESTETNAAEIEALTGVPVVARLGPCASWDEASRVLDAKAVDGLLGIG